MARFVRSTALFYFGVLILLRSSVTFAGGYSYPDLGSVAFSRGGAFVAKADDPTALYYNPAGAANLPGTQILLNGNLVDEDVAFQRWNFSSGVASDRNRFDGVQRMPQVLSVNGPFFAPFFSITSDLGGLLKRFHLRVMAGVYGPNGDANIRLAPLTSATALNPVRYDTLERNGFIVYPSLGAAWEPHPMVRIGFVFQLAWASLDYRTTVSALVGENPDADVGLNLKLKSTITPTGILGIHVRPWRFLELGSSVRIGFSHQMSGEGFADVPSTLAERYLYTLQPNNFHVFKMEVPEPWIIRTGLRYVHHDGWGRERFDVEGDFVFETTSQLKNLTAQLGGDQSLPPAIVSVRDPNYRALDISAVTLRFNWQDTWSLRLGGSYNFFDVWRRLKISLRGGFFYESSSMQPEYTRLAFYPLEKFGTTLGVGVTWNRYEFSIGYGHIFSPRRVIGPTTTSAECSNFAAQGCGSQVREIAPLGPKSEGAVVGNGVVAGNVNILTLGIKVIFGN